MRVLNVIHYSASFGGGLVQHLAALGSEMTARGHGLSLAFPKYQPWFEELRSVAGLHVVPQIEQPLRSRLPAHLDRLCSDLAVDLLHCHFSFALPFSLAVRKRGNCLPLIYHWHNPPKALMRHPGSRPVGRLAADLLARFVDRRVIGHHVAPSQETADLLLNGGWTTPAKLTVITNGVGACLHSKGAGAASLAGRTIIGSVANFRPQKDHETLLQAFLLVHGDLPNTELWLIGDGPTRPSVERLASRLGLAEHVKFLGFVSDPGAVYPELHVFALSTTYEGYPYVLLEAMGHALPVVATRVSSIPELVRDGENGLLAEPRDPDSLARQILRLIQDQHLRNRLVQAAQTEVMTLHSPARWASDVIDLYEQCQKEPTS